MLSAFDVPNGKSHYLSEKLETAQSGTAPLSPRSVNCAL